MSYGYTTRLDSLNKQADDSLLGVRLGRVCIEHNIPVIEIAAKLGVSRQTVYNWFVGIHNPNSELTKSISKIICKYKK
jgi:DNA-binding XRE family transcriptional regulator